MRTGARASRAIVLILLTLAGTCAVSSTADAGGSHLAFDRPWYDVGDVAVGTSDLFPGCCDRGWIDDGPYVAWARPFGALDDAPTFLGPVRIDLVPVDGQSVRRPTAVVEFEVPGLQPGQYSVKVCNEGCVKELGDLVGGVFWIGPPVESPPSVDVAPPVIAPSSPTAPPSAVVDQAALIPRNSSRQSGSALVPWAVGGAAIGLGACVIGLGIVERRRRRAQS